MAPLSDTGTVPPPLITEPDAMNPRTPMPGLRGIAAVGFAALVMACSSSEPPAGSGDGLAGRLVITGSSTVAPLAGELAKQFELLHPGVRIDVQSGGSSRGITDARRGTADIGMVSRAPKAGEEDLTARTIALDGICLIVHADNGVASLSPEQVRGIYTGALPSWRDVGGVDAPITVVHKAEGRSTLELFLAHFELAAADIRPSVVIGDNLHGILTVAGDRNAIGYVSIGTAERELAQGRPIRLLALSGAQPSTASVRAGNYPLSRPLNLVTGPSPSPLALAFIAFAQSVDAEPLVEAQYFVPIAR